MATATYTASSPTAAGTIVLTIGWEVGAITTIRLIGQDVYVTEPGLTEYQVTDRQHITRLFSALRSALLTGVDPG